MIVNLDEHNITCDYYAFVKEGTVPKRALRRACGRLPYVVVSMEYHLKKPFYEMAVRRVVNRSLAVFTIYGQGDIRMTELLKACKEYGIRLEELLCPDRKLKLHGVSKAVDQIVLEYLENKALQSIEIQLGEDDNDEIPEDLRTEAIQAVRQFANRAATLINCTMQDHTEIAQPLNKVQRSLREDNLRATVDQLNGYSAALRELTS